MIQQATYWQAQLNDGTKIRGGQTNLFANDLNVAAVPIDQLTLFTIAHNTYCYTYFVPTKTWYKDGKPATFSYIGEFGMADGSVLLVDKDATTSKLKLEQNY